ncbi:hypothetical protein TcWFU_003103 [Taenia crassiceps]|uniref:Uncharacterized protein n=1 Tax=Taenia crassiceps TaxID=6207 RepID=A0ABR4Q6D4_9CEST
MFLRQSEMRLPILLELWRPRCHLAAASSSCFFIYVVLVHPCAEDHLDRVARSFAKQDSAKLLDDKSRGVVDVQEVAIQTAMMVRDSTSPLSAVSPPDMRRNPTMLGLAHTATTITLVVSPP